MALPGLPGLLTGGLRLAERAGVADLPTSRVPCNVVVSNVPGPQVPLYSCGARVLTHYPVSIPAHGQALNITVQSYDGVMYFGITACAKALPDAELLRDDMLLAYQELAAAHGVELADQSEDVFAQARATTQRSADAAPQAMPSTVSVPASNHANSGGQEKAA